VVSARDAPNDRFRCADRRERMPQLRRVVWLAIVPGALMVATTLLVVILPTWVRPSWLLPVLIAVIVLFMVSVFAGVALKRNRPAGQQQPNSRPGEFGLAPRGVVIAVAMVFYLAAVVAVIVVGQQVFAAYALGGNPEQTVAMTTDESPCSRCSPVVTFNAGGHIYRASLSGSIDNGLHAGVPLVYDQSDPFRVMTKADWQSGRHSTVYVLAAAPIVVILTTFGLWGLATVYGRRFATLRPGAGIAAVRSIGASGRRRGTRTWSVRFSDGTRARYYDRPQLRDALRSRIGPGSSAVNISADDSARLGPTNVQPTYAAPFPGAVGLPAYASYYPQTYPTPGLYGSHEAPPRRASNRVRTIRLISFGLSGIAVIVILVLVVNQGHGTNSRGSAQGSIAATGGDPATDDDCLDGPTAGPSPAATQYLDAAAAAMPEWMRVDATLAAQNGVVYSRDIAGEVSADTTFLAQLQPIQFPASIAATGQQLITAVRGYDSLITSGESGHGYLAAHFAQETRLLQQRSQASGQLRQVLGLPPSQCTLLRP
jgi:hypothetical protein